MKSIIRLTAAAAFLLFGGVAQADVIQFSVTGSPTPSDCSGDYSVGGRGEDCILTAADGQQVSPVIGKNNAGEDDDFISDDYSGDPWNFSWDDVYYRECLEGLDSDGNCLSPGEWSNNLVQEIVYGEWEYRGDTSPIRFWINKNGDGYTVFFYSDDAACDDPADAETFACMDSAMTVFGGTWSGGSGLSHLTFYNGDGTTVPEPGTLALLGLGLIGIGIASRRRRVA